MNTRVVAPKDEIRQHEKPLDLIQLAAVPEAPPPDDFDWVKDDSIVVEEQPSIAIYLNNRNHVVIRQRCYCSDDEDEFVTIAPQNLMAVIDQLCGMAGIASVGKKRR